MAKHFQISTARKDGCLHMKLTGDFNRACARQVVDFFAANKDGASKIVVDTSLLDHPDPLELILSEWSKPEKD